MEKKGITEEEKFKFKYKRFILEWYVKDDRLFFTTSSFEFPLIVELVRAGNASYLGNKTIHYCYGSLRHEIDFNQKTKKIKKEISNRLKEFIEIKVFKNYEYYYKINKYKK